MQDETIAELGRLAEALDICGHSDLAAAVDAAADQLLEQTDDMLDETGFGDNVMTRDPDVADEIYEHRIESIDRTNEYRRY
jgi:hypothetical protein